MAIGISYANSLSGDFVLDARALIVDDFRLRADARQPGANLQPELLVADTGSDLYRPLTTLSFLFNYSVLGGSNHPVGYHALNLLIHLANAILVYRLRGGIRRQVGRWPAVAAIFGVSP